MVCIKEREPSVNFRRRWWETTSEECSRTLGSRKKERKLAADKIFCSTHPLRSFLQRNPAMGPNVYLSSPKKPTLIEGDCILALLQISKRPTAPEKGFHISIGLTLFPNNSFPS